MRLREALAPVLSNLVTHVSWDEPIHEVKADCGNCNQARGINPIYKNSLKCCTFFPFIPNFLIGAILTSTLPGKATIEEAILDQRQMPEGNFLPLGLMPSILYQRRWQKAQPEGYGNDESLLCPHFLKASGGCAIWSARPSACRSFYCESSYGISGLEFWVKFEKLGSSLEATLAQEALLHLGFIEAEIKLSTRFLPRYDAPDAHAYQGQRLVTELDRSWLEFSRDQRIEFYKKCYAFAASLSREDAQKLVGIETGQMENELFSLYWPKVKAYAKS